LRVNSCEVERGRCAKGTVTMIYVIGFAVIVALIVAIAKAASGDRYSKMTDEEYEAEVQRSSRMGAAVTGLQKIIDPSHSAEYVQEQAQRLEADGANSGDGPEAGAGAAHVATREDKGERT
jgi:hypothetical protein